MRAFWERNSLGAGDGGDVFEGDGFGGGEDTSLHHFGPGRGSHPGGGGDGDNNCFIYGGGYSYAIYYECIGALHETDLVQ